MDSKQFIESGALETYAMGLATEQEAKLVAEMVVRYPEVKAELAAVEESLERFDRQNAVAPPTHLKNKILASVSSAQSAVRNGDRESSGGKVVSLNGNANGQPQQNNFYKYAAGILLVITVGSLFYMVSLTKQVDELTATRDQLRGDIDSTFALMEDFKVLIAEDDSETAMLKDKIAVLGKPGMKSIELKGMDVAPDAKAMAYADAKSGDVYLEIMNLPTAPDGMQYQFWGIVDNKPVSAGMIPLEGDTTGMHKMTSVPNAGAYAISLEPKGGSPQPTAGKIYVMGNP